MGGTGLILHARGDPLSRAGDIGFIDGVVRPVFTKFGVNTLGQHRWFVHTCVCSKGL